MTKSHHIHRSGSWWASFLSFVRAAFPVPLLFIFLLGFLLRLYRLPQQSLWFDEYLAYTSLTPLGLKHFLAHFRTLIPEHGLAPSYYVVFYFWAKVVGTSPTFLRLFPVVTGSVSIILLYHLGKRFYSKRAGIVSALLLALSPSQIWFSQELRPYGWMFFLALASILVLDGALTSSKKKIFDWFLYYAITALLVFSHLLAFLVLVPHGIYVLSRRGVRMFILWALPGFMLVLLLCLSFLSSPHVSIEYKIKAPDPDAVRLLLYPVTKDIVSMHTDLSPPWEYSDPEALASFLKPVLMVRPAFDGAMLVLIFSVLALFIFKHLYKGDDSPSVSVVTEGNASRDPLAYSRLIFIIFLILSGSLILASLELVTSRMVSGSSYVTYNMIGFYLAAGYVVSRISRPAVYRCTLLLFALLYLYQGLIFLPYRTHPEWRGAVDYIAEHCTPEDLIIDEWIAYPMWRTKLFKGTPPAQTVLATSNGDACAQAAKFLKRAEAEGRSGVSAWILTEPVMTLQRKDSLSDLVEVFLEGLHEHKLQGRAIDFPGSLPLTLLQVTKDPDSTPTIPQPFSPALDILDFDAFLLDLKIVPESQEEEDLLRGAFQCTVGRWPSIFVHYNPELGFSFLRQKEYRLAAAFGSYLLSEYPYYFMSYFYMGALLALADEGERAKAYFQHAFSLSPHIAFYAADYAGVLCNASGELPSPALSKHLCSFPLTFFVDLDRFLQENAISDPDLSEDSTTEIRRVVPQQLRNELGSHLPDGTTLSDIIFSSQDSFLHLEGWLPLTKWLPPLLYELRQLIFRNDLAAVTWYKEHIEKFPFENIFYERLDHYLLPAALPADYIKQWLELAEKNPDLSGYAAQRLADRGNVKWNEDAMEEAQELFEGALLLDPGLTEVSAKLARRYSSLERPADALTQVGQILQTNLYFPDALAQADMLLEVLNDPERELHFWQMLHDTHSKDWNVIFRLGSSLEKAERYQEGAVVFLSLDEEDAFICHGQLAAARCLRLSKQLAEAQILLDTFAAESCDPPRLVSYEYIELGQSFLGDGEGEASAACFNRALDIGGFDSLACFGLFEIALARDDNRNALAYLQQSVDADENNMWHRQRLAQEQVKAGLFEEALVHFEILLEAKPDDPGLKHELISLLEEDLDGQTREQIQGLMKRFSEP